jgi:hypothetical protein
LAGGLTQIHRKSSKFAKTISRSDADYRHISPVDLS